LNIPDFLINQLQNYRIFKQYRTVISNSNTCAIAWNLPGLYELSGLSFFSYPINRLFLKIFPQIEMKRCCHACFTAWWYLCFTV